jgi:hypothetical protein
MNVRYDDVQQVVQEIGCIVQNIQTSANYSILDVELELQDIVDGYNKTQSRDWKQWLHDNPTDVDNE